MFLLLCLTCISALDRVITYPPTIDYISQTSQIFAVWAAFVDTIMTFDYDYDKENCCWCGT